jgi:hypothetical protein
MKFPVDFEGLAKGAKSASGGGYPIQISAADLMKDFKYAALDAEAGLITESGGTRKLTIPAPSGSNKVLGCEGSAMTWKDDIPIPPTTGTHVLGSVDGVLQWIATEEC